MEEGVYLLKLELENVRCFGEKTMLNLSDENGSWKRWTVILGDNGTGKTSLLRILAQLETFEMPEHLLSKNQSKPQLATSLFSYFGYSNSENVQDIQREIKAILISPTGKFFISVSNKKTGVKAPVIINIFGYGANRFMNKASLSPTDLVLFNSSLTLFDDNAKLINAEEWLLNLDYAASRESEIKTYAIKKREQVKKLLLEILPDIEDIRFTEPTKEKLVPAIEFKTPYGWVTIHQLSLGYKTMVAWMVDLAARMFERYPDSDNPLAEPAIVLVDEIDLHMHPKWQRRIFDYLSDRFPKTQFIVTAHSPLIVQSAPKDANIVLLRREGDHVIIDNDIQSVHNWRIDQILNSDLFGNISQRKPEVEDWMKERETLLQKEKLTKDEKKRLEELEEQTDRIPTADNQRDIEAMEIIRKAADYLKTQTA